ncbi:disintegrin and metalloproteinase domain-containing protein 21-like [Echinops telfairi]|uniref:Disintegrin and metalloproteinase domain-containing protein 21-like n=1 Tax=Echinops telfairi TaxID=9371 RepID=A0ABM1VKJ2_ECHTE|nr:disintegrin and metalloproteinase domain-containing protein 21-like [Echinops telfairi]
MGLAEGQVTLRGSLSMLGLCVLLAPVQSSAGRPSWRYISSEVVVPRKQMPPGKGVQVLGWLSYTLSFGGQRHLIHMRRKKVFGPRHVPVMSQDDQGASQMDFPYLPHDCYYLGFLEEIPYSMVTINTCYGGLEGIMKLDDLAYEIKPLKDSLMFEHVISEIVADANAIGPMYRLGYKDPPLSKENISAALRISSKIYASHAGVIEGLPSSSHEVYELFNNVSQCITYLIDIASMVDSIFCTNLGMNMIGHLGRHYYLLSVVVAFQSGRSIGFYVDGSQCYCQRRSTCIMFRYPLITDVFSNCTIVHLGQIFLPKASCVYDLPRAPFNESLIEHRCGNARVEGKEQCDCGSYKECYIDKCCRTDCRLTPGSICHKGGCCTNCTYSPMGTLCRPIQNICDLPEYCTGVDYSCLEDVYLQDGTPCTEEGYCFHGNCTDRSMHCKEIFGEGAVNADDICYNINRKGNRFGHCRRNIAQPRHQACNVKDVRCGKLQCTNVTHLPLLQDHVSFHHSLISGAHCFGLDEHRSTEATDVGHVRPGTPCGAGKFCTSGSYCNGILTELNYDCHPRKCSYRGMCNNHRNCHCHRGWEPPLCLRPGAGGSENSGPPPRRFRAITPSDQPVFYMRLVFGRIYAFIGALLFGIAKNGKTIQKTES